MNAILGKQKCIQCDELKNLLDERGTQHNQLDTSFAQMRPEHILFAFELFSYIIFILLLLYFYYFYSLFLFIIVLESRKESRKEKEKVEAVEAPPPSLIL
jgi:hypothetical protein